MLAVVGSNTFACTYEENANCLLSDYDVSMLETWHVVDGVGFVADNTMNSGE